MCAARPNDAQQQQSFAGNSKARLVFFRSKVEEKIAAANVETKTQTFALPGGLIFVPEMTEVQFQSINWARGTPFLIRFTIRKAARIGDIDNCPAVGALEKSEYIVAAMAKSLIAKEGVFRPSGGQRPVNSHFIAIDALVVVLVAFGAQKIQKALHVAPTKLRLPVFVYQSGGHRCPWVEERPHQAAVLRPIRIEKRFDYPNNCLPIVGRLLSR